MLGSKALWEARVKDGRLQVVRGRIPAALLDDLLDAARRAPRERASLHIYREGDRARVEARGASEAFAQRCRNLVALHSQPRLLAVAEAGGGGGADARWGLRAVSALLLLSFLASVAVLALSLVGCAGAEPPGSAQASAGGEVASAAPEVRVPDDALALVPARMNIVASADLVALRASALWPLLEEGIHQLGEDKAPEHAGPFFDDMAAATTRGLLAFDTTGEREEGEDPQFMLVLTGRYPDPQTLIEGMGVEPEAVRTRDGFLDIGGTPKLVVVPLVGRHLVMCSPELWPDVVRTLRDPSGAVGNAADFHELADPSAFGTHALDAVVVSRAALDEGFDIDAAYSGAMQQAARDFRGFSLAIDVTDQTSAVVRLFGNDAEVTSGVENLVRVMIDLGVQRLDDPALREVLSRIELSSEEADLTMELKIETERAIALLEPLIHPPPEPPPAAPAAPAAQPPSSATPAGGAGAPP